MRQPVLPPIQRDAHERLVREAVLVERKRCATIAEKYVNLFDSQRKVGTALKREILKEPA